MLILPEDDPLIDARPLISEKQPSSLINSVKEMASKISDQINSEKSDSSPPLISEIPIDQLGEVSSDWLGTDDHLVVDFDELLNNKGLINYLLKTNTFFHGKIGFYQHIIDKIYKDQTSMVSTDNAICTIDQLQNIDLPAQNQHPLILMPIVESNDAFNYLIAKGFENSLPIWLIAHPLTIHSHLLVAFHNFFIASSTNAEIEHLQQFFQLSPSTVQMLRKGTFKAILVTDYKPLVPKGNSQTSVTLRFEHL